jgi:glucokinase
MLPPTVLTEPTMKQAEVDQKLNRTAFADGPRLLADIGATHARFALQTAPGEFRAVRVLKCDDYPTSSPCCDPIWPTMPAST